MHIFWGSNLCYIELWLCLIVISYDHISFMSMTNVFSSILSYLVIELKGKWSIWQRRRFHSTPSVLSTLCRYSAISPFWYNLHSYIVCQRGREIKKGSNDSVFGDSCQRGREYEPKAKGPHHHQFSKILVFQRVFSNWYLTYDIISYWYTLLITKRRISLRGSFV
jgi:hypothetical protein